MQKVEVKSVLTKQKKRDDWFLCDYSLKPFVNWYFGNLILILW